MAEISKIPYNAQMGLQVYQLYLVL